MKDDNPVKSNDKNKSKKALNTYSLAGIGIGGMVGSGFFLGTALAIKQAGPSVILAFILGGFIMSQVLGAMTSISINRPVTGSFRVYTEEFLGKFTGYLLGWIIYVSGILGIASEAIASAVFLKYWMPGLSVAFLALSVILLTILINMLQMKYFGYIESGIAVLKIIIMVAFIVIGLTYILSHGVQVKPSPFSGIQYFFPNRISGLLQSMLIVVFTYSGISTIAMAASEVKKPAKSIPKATILVTAGSITLYVLTMLVVVLTVDTRLINISSSPLIQSLNSMNVNWISGIINFIILIATFSVMLGAYYSCDQMLVSLSQAKEAPSIFNKKQKRDFYKNAWLLTGALSILIIMLSFSLSSKLFNYLVSASSYFSFFNWIINLTVYIIWSKRRTNDEKYDSPLILGRTGAYCTIIIIFILFIMSLKVQDFRIGFYSAAVISFLIIFSYKLYIRRKNI
mgnify:CR=1 FL=1